MENDFIIVLNDQQISCNKKFVNSNFREFCKKANISDNKIELKIDDGHNFFDVTEAIFQGKYYKITNENFYYLSELSQQLKSSKLQIELNSFSYQRECNDNQIDQHPAIQFLIEVSSLIRKLSFNNYEDYSTQIIQKLIPSIDDLNSNLNNRKSNNKQETDESDNSEKEYDDEYEESDDVEKVISLDLIGTKAFNKLLFYDVINTLSLGFNSIEELREHQKKVDLIVQLIKEIDIANQRNSNDSNFYLNSFIAYVIKKYNKVKEEQITIQNNKQETFYLIHYLLSKKLIHFSQILKETDPVEFYFLEFYPKEQIVEFFQANEQIVAFLNNELTESKSREKTKIKPKEKTRSKSKKQTQKEEGNEDDDINYKLIKLQSEIIKNGLFENNELFNILFNDDLQSFKEKFNDELIDSYILPDDISKVSCLSALYRCSIIELSAFLGCQNIFEYLNEKMAKKEIDQTNNLYSSVILGQNPQIIKIFLSSIDFNDKKMISNMLSFCYDHNFNDTYDMVFNMVKNCPKPNLNQLEQYMKSCISKSYFEIIPSLLKEGANINVLLNLFSKTNNEIGIEYMVEFSYIDVNFEYNKKSALEYCIENKNSNSSVLLLKNDYINLKNIDDKLENGEKVIHIACRYGLAKIVSYLLRKHLYDVNVPTQHGICPIHLACESGNIETVKTVIRTKKVHIRARVKEGEFKKRTALHFACCSGNSKIITLLLDSDERLGLDDIDGKGRTPIIYAIKGDFVDCVYDLLEQEEININQEYKGNNLLQYACIKNKTKVFNVLLDSIVFDPNLPCQDGRVILVVAIENRNTHIVKSILNKFKNIDINIDTSNGKTPLFIACQLGDVEIIKLLLDSNTIKINKPISLDGSTPFMAAAEAGNVEVLQLLLNDDADIFAKNKQEMSAIHSAFFSQKIEAVKFLLPFFNEKLNEKTSNGETLFQIACKNDKKELLKLLIENPAVDINIQDDKGMTAFLTSVQKGDINLVESLIKNDKTDLNDKTNDGRNAFIIAIQNQNLNLVKLFIQLYSENNQNKTSKKNKKNKKRFVDITEKTNKDITPLFIALKQKNKSILEELINCPFIDINETSKNRTFLSKVTKKMTSRNIYNSSFAFDYYSIFNLVLQRSDLELNKPSKRFGNNTFLHFLCKSEKHDIKIINRMCNMNGVDINAGSREGTPLYLLIKYQSQYFKETVNDKMKQILENKKKIQFNNMKEILKNPANSKDYSDDENSEVLKSDEKIESKINDEDSNYWYHILDNPLLDLNKGGDPNYTNSFNRGYFLNSRNNNEDDENYLNNLNETPLELAIKRGYSNIIDSLISKNDVDINYCNIRNKRTPLHVAILNEKIDLIHKILSKSEVKVNIQDIDGNTPLILGIQSNSKILSDVVLSLLQRRDIIEGINIKNKNDVTPFLASITNPNQEIFNKLLTIKEVDLEFQDKKGRTFLYLLVKSMYRRNSSDNIIYERIVSLIEKCPSLLNIPTKSGKTPLFYSILYGRNQNNYNCNFNRQKDVISYLLDQKDIDLSVPDDLISENDNYDEKVEKNKIKIKYTSLLHVACKNGANEVIKKLLPLVIEFYKEKGKNERIFSQEDNDGNTILNIACSSSNVDIITNIIDYIKDPTNGINYNDTDVFDINAKSSSGLTPLHYICKLRNDSKSLHLLNEILSFDYIDINAISSNENRTALHYCCVSNCQEFIEKLINFAPSTIDANIYDINYNTPLLLSVNNGYSSNVEQLLKLDSIDVNMPNKQTGKTPFYISCERSISNGKIVSLLLNDERTDINCQEKNTKNTALLYCIQNKRDKLVSLILSKDNVDINSVDNQNNTALHHACYSKNEKYIDELINYNPNLIDPNIYNKMGLTPLLIAADSKNSELIKCLLKLDTLDVNLAQPRTNETALYIACKQWNPEIVSILLNDSRTDPNIRTKASGKTVLMHSLQEYKIDLVHLILNNEKTDISIVDNNSLNALHYACKIGNIDIIDLIISKKKEKDESDLLSFLNAKDKNGLTPFHYACMSNNKDVILYFLNLNKEENLIDIEICDNNNEKPFDIYLKNPASHLDDEIYDSFSKQTNQDKIETNVDIFELFENGRFEKVKLMIMKMSFDINKVNSDKMTLLHILCKNQKIDLIKLLLSKMNEFDIDINPIDMNNMTPLHHAVQSNFDSNVVNLLLNTNKCDLNVKDNKGRTALHYACEFRKTSIIQELLKHNDIIDINSQDKQGSTVLHDIANSPLLDFNILHLLLNSNCNPIINPNIQDKNGNAPIHIACLKQNNLFVSSLIDLCPVEIDINIINKKYQTPLFIVCMKNDFHIFKILFSSKLSSKIDINLTAPIYIAAYKGNFQLFEKLFEMPKIDINCNRNQTELRSDESDNEQENDYDIEYDFSGLNLLHIVSSYNSTELLKKLISLNFFDINETTEDYISNDMNGTPLIIALKNMQLSNVYLLLNTYKSQLDLSIYDNRGYAAIHHCLNLNENEVNVLQEMIKIDPTIINMRTNSHSKSTPLLIAFKNNKIDCITFLLQQPTIDIFSTSKEQNTIIHFAVANSRKEFIDIILTKIKSLSANNWKKFVDLINMDNTKGETALLIACKKQNIYIVNSLIDTFKDSLDFSICDNEFVSPFLAAIYSRNDKLINLLLKTDFCMNTIDLSQPANDNNDYYPLLMAKNSKFENFVLLMQLIPTHSSDLKVDLINVKNNKNESLLTYVINNQKLDLFNYICETQNPNINIFVDEDDEIPLILDAVLNYDFDMFESILINYGSFNINQKYDGKTLLHYACECSDDPLEKVKLLIEQDNIDVNCTTDKDGSTPLHIAVKNKKLKLIEALLSLNDKIDINIANKKNKSPLDMAKTKPIIELFDNYKKRIKKK